MEPRKLFRILLMLGILSAVIGITINGMFEHLLPAEMKALNSRLDQQEDMSSLSLIFMGCMGIVISIVGIASIVGLYQFRHWGRVLNLVLGILGFIVAPFSATYAELAMSRSFYDLSMALWGAVTAMSYLDPIRKEFESDDYRARSLK